MQNILLSHFSSVFDISNGSTYAYPFGIRALVPCGVMFEYCWLSYYLQNTVCCLFCYALSNDKNRETDKAIFLQSSYSSVYSSVSAFYLYSCSTVPSTRYLKPKTHFLFCTTLYISFVSNIGIVEFDKLY